MKRVQFLSTSVSVMLACAVAGGCAADSGSDCPECPVCTGGTQATGGTGAGVSSGGTGAGVASGGTGAGVATGGTGAGVSSGGTGAGVAAGGTGGTAETGGTAGTGGTAETGGTAGTGGTAETGGTGGVATGGTGGTGGTATGSVCDGASFEPESAMVSNVEGGVTAGWDIYASTPTDADSGAVLTAPASGSHEDPPEVASEGADGTNQSVHYAGTGWYSYGAGINFNLEGCKDLTGYTGVRFYARGSTTPGANQTMPPTLTANYLNFRVITAGSHAVIMEGGVNVGGDCDPSLPEHGCFMPPQYNITLTSEWQLYEIPFTSLVTPDGANPGSAFNGTNAMLLGWHSENGDFDFYIDQVEFY